MVRIRCALFQVDTTHELLFVDVDVSPRATVAALRNAIDEKLVIATDFNRLLGPAAMWKLYVATENGKQDGEWLDVHSSNVRQMTSTDILRSGRQPIDPTLTLESKSALGRDFYESNRLNVSVVVRNKDEWLSLKVALLEEDGFDETMHLRVEIPRSATVTMLKHSIADAYLERDPRQAPVDFVWRVYLAREIDGSWPIYEDVQAMTSRELVQSCRHHMRSGARLDDQEAFGQQPPEHSIHVLAIASPRRDELDDLLSELCHSHHLHGQHGQFDSRAGAGPSGRPPYGLCPGRAARDQIRAR